MKRSREDGLAKPRALTPTVRRLIVHRAISQRQTPRDYLAHQLIREITEAGDVAPTLETMKRYISKARNAHNPLDQPWTLACCSHYPALFPPDTIPAIIHQKHCTSEVQSDLSYKEIFGVNISDFSIRCAIWIARLHPVIQHLTPKLMIDDQPLPSTYLFVVASTYAMAEMASEILGQDHFDSQDLDIALFAGDTRSFMRITLSMYLATTKPCRTPDNCDSCDYMKLPALPGTCIPRRKEAPK